MAPRETVGLCYLYNGQLMTPPDISTLPFTIQFCYKPLDILQRVTERRKVHISSHNGLQNVQNTNLAWHGSKGSSVMG